MIPFSPPRIDDKVIAEVTEALKSGWITTGPRTKQFEKNITAYCDCKTTVAVNSWTMGMQVLLNWWGIKEGDEVIIPAYTYCASANVIVHAGATPVMVDLIKEDFNLSVEKVKAAITPKTKAILIVHLYGQLAEIDTICNIAKINSLLVILEIICFRKLHNSLFFCKTISRITYCTFHFGGYRNFLR